MSFQYTPTRVSREDIVEWSVFTFIKNGLIQAEIPIPAQVDFKEAFNTNLFEGEIDKSWIAPGFHMGDGGKLFEMGSNLRRQEYTFEYWIIGLNATQGRNLAHIIKQLVDANLVIPILDITQPEPFPVIGALESAEEPSTVKREIVGQPEPWQQHLYCAYVKVVDFYYDSASGPMFSGYDGGTPWAGPLGEIDGGMP